MRIKIEETLADGELEAAILRLKKEYPEAPLSLCADYIGHLLKTLSISEDDLSEFMAEQMAELEESSDEFDGLPVDDFYQVSKDLEFLADYPPHWDNLPPGEWVNELP